MVTVNLFEFFTNPLLHILGLLFLRGTFKMEKEDGSTFECKIPPFSLESKVEE